MNRQLKPLFLLGTALLLATACTNDDTDTVDITRPIDLHLSPARTVTAETKVVIDGEAFDPEDVIGLYLAWTDGATTEVPITQTITQTTWKGNAFTGESLYWQNTADEHTIYAYYPYSANVEGYKVPVTIPDVQNADDEKTCNILYGTFSGTARNNVQIQMRHCMSLVNITLKKGAGYGENEPMPNIDKVTLNLQYHTSGTLDLATGKVTADEEGTKPDITTYLLTDDTTPDVPDYRAILMPGETLDLIIITTDDGTDYEYEPETAPVTEANTQYNFTLELNKAGVELLDLDITPWGKTEEYTGGADMDIWI